MKKSRLRQLMFVTILASSAVACGAETPSSGGLDSSSRGTGSSDTAGGASHAGVPGAPSSGAPASGAPAGGSPASTPAAPSMPPPSSTPPAASTAPPPTTPPAVTPPPAKIACATPTDAVTAAYKLALLRDPDAAGLSYWLLQLQAGQTRFEMLENFIRSDEFSKARAGLTDTQFVTSLYAGLLGRAPDAAGLAYYVDVLTNGGVRSDVALGFVNSDEFADPKKNPTYACFF